MTGKETDTMVLKELAINGPEICNRIHKRTNIPNSTVDEALKRLLSKGYVHVRTLDPIGHRLGQKEYSLTAFGLIHVVISTRPEEWKPVIDSWSNLFPYVIGKWDVFVNAGVEDLAMRKLKIAAEEMSIRAYSGPLMGNGYTPLSYDDEFYYRFYRPNGPILEREKQLRWAEACDTDPEVRHYFRRALLIDLDLSERLLQIIEFMQQTLQDNDEKRKKTDPRKR